MVSAFAFPGGHAVAQIRPEPDSSLGTQVVPLDDLTDQIREGTLRGNSLFHSFIRFDVGEGRSVYFDAQGASNILSRVTGNDPSRIFGRLGVGAPGAPGNTNLYLMNPNGIIFGPGASLDLAGSFIATTADRIRFASQEFSSNISDSLPSEPLLNVNPSALVFSRVLTQPITVQGSLLSVGPRQNLGLFGGNVSVDGSSLSAGGGLVALGGLAGSGMITLLPTLSFSDSPRADVLLSNGAEINVIAGDGGEIDILARNIDLTSGSSILAGIGRGLGSNESKAGNILLDATDTVTLSGSRISSDIFPGATGFLDEDILTSVVNLDLLFGSILIFARSLSMTDAAVISASNFGIGSTGLVYIGATDQISLASGSRIFSTIGGFDVDGSLVTARGFGGAILIEAGSLSLTGNSGLSTILAPSSAGFAGGILLDLKGNLRAEDSTIAAFSSGDVLGGGGPILITAQSIRLVGDSDILTFDITSGIAIGGGNVTLTAESIIGLDDSDILAFAPDGQGGTITINTPVFFGFRYSPTPPGSSLATLLSLDGNDRADVNASGLTQGVVSLPEQFVPTELPDVPVDTDSLLANSCIARSKPLEGSFTVTGSGGLPDRPGDTVESPYETGEVRPLPSEQKPSPSGPGSDAVPGRPWQIGDPIVEPQGVYRLSDGRLVLSTGCS